MPTPDKYIPDAKQNGIFVHATVVKTRHLYADMLQTIRNMLGMNLRSYENMTDEGIKEALQILNDKYEGLDPHSIKIATANAASGAIMVIVSGVADRAK